MILTGKEIEKEVCKGNITIDPFSIENLNPNSYNYHLGKELLIIEGEQDCKLPQDAKSCIIPEEGLILEPSKLYLGVTEEKIGSRKFVTSLIGRSSIGRLGLFLQITADLAQLGNSHKWTLELHVVKKLRVYAGMKIGQVSFWTIYGDSCYNYQDLYNNSNRPLVSKINIEFPL